MNREGGAEALNASEPPPRILPTAYWKVYA